MASVNSGDQNVFSELYKTVQDNFTEEEVQRVHALAEQLKQIVNAAKQRLAGGS